MTNPEANRVKIKGGDNFTSRIIGDMSYVDWYWWFPNNGRPDQKTPLRSDVDGGQTTIEPRYDDSRLGNGRNTKNDPDFSEGEYQKQWDVAKAWIEAGKCKIVLIGTWNDYTERTQVEPCFDATSFTPYPFYLLDITRANILAPRHYPGNLVSEPLGHRNHHLGGCPWRDDCCLVGTTITWRGRMRFNLGLKYNYNVNILRRPAVGHWDSTLEAAESTVEKIT